MSRLTEQAARILDEVAAFASARGQTVYLVGGFIRDRLLRRACADIDITMEADALEFARSFASAKGYGPAVFYGRFGTAMLNIGGVKVEFATCRAESYPEESRKPEVRPSTIHEDLARRDFTINAIAENLLTGETLDPFSGRADIKARIIRTPLDPDTTFRDDPLRILRGIRFAGKFRFTVSAETLAGMARQAERLRIVSGERIAEEVLRMLEASQPSRCFLLLDAVGALELVLPEVSALKERGTEHPCKELFDHTLKTLDNACRKTRSVPVRLAALLHDIGKPKTLRVEQGKVSFHRHEFVGERMASRVCQRLYLGAEDTRLVTRLIRLHLRPHLLAKENPTDRGLRRFIREVGRDMKPLLTLARADITSANPGRIRRAQERIDHLETRITEINRRDRLSTFKLAVDGHAVMEILGIPPSRAVGWTLSHLEQRVLDGKLPNRKRDLKRYLAHNRSRIVRMSRSMVG